MIMQCIAVTCLFVCFIIHYQYFHFIVCFFRESMGWLFKKNIYKAAIKINEKGGCMVKLAYSILFYAIIQQL